MLISLATSFFVLTLMAAILVPQRGKPTGLLFENYFLDIFVLKSTVGPEIVIVSVCFYPPPIKLLCFRMLLMQANSFYHDDENQE